MARPESPPTIAVGLYSYQIGGSEKIGAELALGYARRGYDVCCFAFYDSSGPVLERLVASGIRCIDLNYLRGRWGIRRFTYQLKLWWLLRRSGFDAIHVHHTTSLLLCGLAARAAGIRRLMMTEHAIHELEADPRYKRNARFYARLAHEITVVHAGLVDYFVTQIGVPARRVHYVPNGVTLAPAEATDRAQVRTELAANGIFVFLFAGRLHPTKDLGTLLHAVALLKGATGASFEVWLLGDGDERPLLEALVVQLGITDRVRFLGPTSNVNRYLAASDCFVMSSKTEGLPMVLVEAMSKGVPCIATAVGGIPELFSSGGGLVVPAQSPTDLATAMRRLLEDEVERARLSASGLLQVQENYDIERVIDRYLELLQLPPTWSASVQSR
jgi:glycosyltransferase involved in cell wall biosynthesis